MLKSITFCIENKWSYFYEELLEIMLIKEKELDEWLPPQHRWPQKEIDPIEMNWKHDSNIQRISPQKHHETQRVWVSPLFSDRTYEEWTASNKFNTYDLYIIFMVMVWQFDYLSLTYRKWWRQWSHNLHSYVPALLV